MPQAMEQTSPKTIIRQLAGLAGFITSVLADLPFEQVKYWLGKKTELRRKLIEVFKIPVDPYAEVRTKWQVFYKKHLKLDADFSAVVIPPKPTEGEWRLIFILKGLKMNFTLAAMRVLFKVWVYQEDLDATVTTNTRTSAASYAVWVRVGVEPDEKYLGKSTRDADPEGKIGMTLLERMIFEIVYFTETGKYLDTGGVTFCTASRGAGGRVPGMYWDHGIGEVGVDAYGVGDSDPVGGLREAVAR